MKLNARRIGLILGVIVVGLIAWYVWPFIPQVQGLSKAFEKGPKRSADFSSPRGPDTGGPASWKEPRPAHEIVGIGAALKWDSDYAAPQIAEVLPNSPALQAGLSPGLIIQRIDDVSTTAMGLSGCVKLIRGPVGTKVRLDLLDPEGNETNRVELTRQRVGI